MPERGGRRILDGIDIEIGGGGTLALIGPNGAGKSLLARVLAGLVVPATAGRFGPAAPPTASRTQDRLCVSAACAAAPVGAGQCRIRAGRGRCCPPGAAGARPCRAGARLAHLAHVPARVLSGGEQQLLAIARALATGPEILILDEPTSNLDPAATAAIEALVGAVRREGVRVLLITHDLGQVRRLADEVAFLHRGRIVERMPAPRFLTQPSSPEAQAFMRGEIVVYSARRRQRPQFALSYRRRKHRADPAQSVLRRALGRSRGGRTAGCGTAAVGGAAPSAAGSAGGPASAMRPSASYRPKDGARAEPMQWPAELPASRQRPAPARARPPRRSSTSRATGCAAMVWPSATCAITGAGGVSSSSPWPEWRWARSGRPR